MPADTSPNSESTRYERAKAEALKSLNGSPPSEERKKRNQSQVKSPAADPTPRPGGRGPQSSITDIVAAFAGSPADDAGTTVWTEPDGEGRPAPKRDDDAGAEGSGRSDGKSPLPNDRPALDLSDEEDPFTEGEKPRRRKPLAAFMEKHGIGKPDQIYDLEVPFSDRDGIDGTVTFGELKDHYKQSRNLVRERDDFEDYRTSVQNELITARQEMDVSMGLLRQTFGDDVLREIFPKAGQQLQQQALQGKRQLLEWFPEWDDAQVKAADRDKTAAMLKSYGFSDQEFSNVLDPRLIRFAVHAMRMQERYERSKKAWLERDKKPSKEEPSRKGHRPNATETADRLAKSGDKIGAVASLFGA